MKSDMKQLFSFLLTIFAVSVLCVGLYRFNNKNTYSTLQPVCGQITISDNSLSDLCFLVNDWELYPDVLLTPEDLLDSANDLYMIYTDIGQRTRFDWPSKNSEPHGCGSYALHLWLPEGKRSYSLELPEIFSAYRLYINGEEYLQVGNPDPDSYSARTQSKLITFYGEGQVDILIAVSDYSHFYSGIVYPPILGLPSVLSGHRDLRLALSLFILSISLLVSTFMLYLSISLKKKGALLFALLSLNMGFVLGFPTLHMLFELTIFPWYTLELFCIYLMMLLTLILHNQVCKVPSVPSRISVVSAALFLILAVCYGLASPILTVTAMRAFSRVLFCYKLCTALYLLVTALFSLLTGHIRNLPVLHATVAYAVIYLWDRILPSYDPIYLGYFSDWGNMILVFTLGYCMITNIISSYLRSLSFKEEYRQINRQLAMQTEYTRQISKHMEQNRRLIHDFRQHLRTIQSLAQAISENSNTHADDLLSYVNDLASNTFSRSSDVLTTFCTNPALNALLQYYASVTKQLGIETDFRLLPLKVKLSDTELCTILGNLLENAIEACRHLPADATKSISLHSLETEHMLFIRIENTYDGVLKTDEHSLHYFSRKNTYSRYGIGMESVREIIERHDGTLDIYPKEKIFRVGISLPLTSDSDFC